MSKRAWISAVAIGLVCFSPLGEAQEQAGQPKGQTEQEQQKPGALYPPVRVEIVEEKTAADARYRREEETRQREIEDLRAQQGMNTATQAMNAATQDMRNYAFYSTIFAFIGVAGLLVTLFLMYRANKAASQAAVYALEANQIARKEQRPWLKIGFDIEDGIAVGDNQITCTILPNCKNIGSRPAINAHVWAGLSASDNAADVRDEFLKFVEDRKRWYGDTPEINTKVIFPGECWEDTGLHYGRANISSSDAVKSVHVFVIAIYRDTADDGLCVTAQSYTVWGFEMENGFQKPAIRGNTYKLSDLRQMTEWQPSIIT